jgi:hypothetical protein
MILAKYTFYKNIFIGILAITGIFYLEYSSLAGDTEVFQKIEQSKIPDELTMLATATKTNYEKIKTWQGKIFFDSTIMYRGTYAADLVKQDTGSITEEPNEVAEIAVGTKEFKIDLEKNLLFRSMNRPKPLEHIDVVGGKTYTSSKGSLEMKKLISNDYEIESTPYIKKKDGTILNWMAEKKPHKKQASFDESDPRYCFTIGKPCWVVLSEFSDGVRLYNRDPNGIVGKVPNSYFSGISLEKSQTAKGVTYRLLFKIPGVVEEVITFDGDKGFNPTFIEVKNAKSIKITEIKRDFIKIQDVYLPSEQQEIQYDGEDGLLRRAAKSTFSDMQVNMTLPENTFSLNNLGLKDGDKFEDKIAGKKYSYQDANLVLINEPNNPPK